MLKAINRSVDGCLHIFKMNFLIALDLREFLNGISERFSFFDDVFIGLEMILMNDRIYSVHGVNDGGNFLF